MLVRWQIPEDQWKGETAFIVGGGPSVAYQPTHRLKGRKVIVINSAYETCPFADYLFFGDNRWWIEHYARLKAGAFKGQIVTVSAPAAAPEKGDPVLFKLDRIVPTSPKLGFTATGRGLSSQKTSFQGAINLAAMLGAKRLVLLGLDGARWVDGRTHHHKLHKWKMKPGNITWDLQYTQLKFIVAPLAARGVEVFNTSPITRCPFWPVAPLGKFL